MGVSGTGAKAAALLVPSAWPGESTWSVSLKGAVASGCTSGMAGLLRPARAAHARTGVASRDATRLGRACCAMASPAVSGAVLWGQPATPAGSGERAGARLCANGDAHAVVVPFLAGAVGRRSGTSVPKANAPASPRNGSAAEQGREEEPMARDSAL